MKKLKLILLLLTSQFVLSQTTVEFEGNIKNLKINSTTELLEFDISVNNFNDYNSTENMYLKIISQNENNDFFKDYPEDGINFLISNDSSKKIKVKIDPDKLVDGDILQFDLIKNDSNRNYKLGENLTVFYKIEKDKESTIVVSLFTEEITLQKNDDFVNIPLNVNIEGYIPTKSDNLKLTVNIEGFDNLIFENDINEFDIIGKQNIINLKLLSEKDEIISSNFLELKNRNNLRIVLEVNDTGNYKTKFKESEIDIKINSTYSSENNYHFYIGTNFDLKEKLEATSYYAEISTLLTHLAEKNFLSKLGIRAGIYKNNNTINNVYRTNNEPGEYFSNEFNIIQQINDSIIYKESRVKYSRSRDQENLGVYADVFYKISENKNSNINLGFHFEVTQRTVKSYHNGTELYILSQDTISLADLRNNNILMRNLEQPLSSSERFYSSYFGISSPIYIKNNQNSFEVFFNPSIGMGSPGKSINKIVVEDDGTRTILRDNDFKLYSFMQFGLTEKKFGIRLSGEVRKYFSYNQDPMIVINLSKNFNLSKLFDSEEN